MTIEDPIEFLHDHKLGTVHQRELHSDTPDFALALRAALRQAPKVILVGEMRDRETIEVALEAAETGHLVLSTLHTIDAAKTIDRIIGVFPKAEEAAIRTRLSQSFRRIISQRLLPKVGGGRKAPESNVALADNAAGADENLIEPPPPPDIRTMPLNEQLSRAFAAAFGAKDQAQLQIAGRTLVYHPGKLFT